MNRRAQNLGRIALGFALALAVPASPAAEDSAPTRPPAPSADAIDAAKQDFQAIKSARENALQPKADLPRFTVPDLSAPSPAAAGVPTPKSGELEKKSRNWLLDAMEKSDPRRERERGKGDFERGRLSHGREAEKPAGDGLNVAREDARSEKADTPERAERKGESVFNPFARYLGTWMTPQDYALLKPGFDSSLLAGASPLKSPAAPSPLGAELSELPGVGFNSALNNGGAASRTGLPGPPPHENPYLALMNSAPPVASAPPPPPTPVAPALVPPPAAGPPVMPPAKSAVPEFAKPPVEEKYLKQLKKF